MTAPISVHEHYKKYMVEERNIVWQKPNHEQPVVGISYKGPKDGKKIYLANLRQDAKPVYIATNLEPNKEHELISILQEFKDVFAWSYKDLKGVDPVAC